MQERELVDETVALLRRTGYPEYRILVEPSAEGAHETWPGSGSHRS